MHIDTLLGLFYVYKCLHVCKCATCLPDAHRSQKRLSDPMELELGMVVSYNVNAGYGFWILSKNYWSCREFRIHLSSPCPFFETVF